MHACMLFQHTLSKLPLAVGIPHGYALGLFDVLILDGSKEPIKEACSKEA